MKLEAPFQLDFVLEGKSVSVAEDGDLIIEGYASDFETDRDEEAFTPGALERGLKTYMETNPVLCLGHDPHEKALGQVLELRKDAKGWFVKARVDKPEPNTWAADAFRKIERGTLRAFSVGGRFFRKLVDGAVKIHDADITDISVVAIPANPRTLFAVAGKAFGGEPAPEVAPGQLNLDGLDALGRAFDALEGKAATSSKPWDGSPGRFTDEQYVRSCLIKGKGKSDSHLPVREPDGTLNCRAVDAAKARLGQVKGASAEQLAAARKKLSSLDKTCEVAQSGG